MPFQNKSGFALQSDPYGPPPSYDKVQTGSKWSPKNWSKKAVLGAVAAAIIVVAAVVLGAVFGSKASKYPDYSALTYSLQDTYSGTDFFDKFDYFTGYDPSSGFVHYVPYDTATSDEYNLTYASSSSAVLRVDTTDTDASTGRYSVRITSKTQYDSGLFIFDVLNSPYGCSTWPALWLSDVANWPKNGTRALHHSITQRKSLTQTSQAKST